MNPQQPSAEHFQGIINRLSAKIGSLTVENSSLLQSLNESAFRVKELEERLAQLEKEPQEADAAAAG